MIKIDYPAGTRVEWAIRNARTLCGGTGQGVEMRFNGVTLCVNENTDIHALYKDYLMLCMGLIKTDKIGPGTRSSVTFDVVVVIYGEIEECRRFDRERDRDLWMEGAFYGADKYGGSIQLYTESKLPDDKNLRDNVWLVLLEEPERGDRS